MTLPVNVWRWLFVSIGPSGWFGVQRIVREARVLEEPRDERVVDFDAEDAR